MEHMIADEIVSQMLTQVIGALLAALVAAVGVGGAIWKKMNANELQDKRMDELQQTIEALLKLVKTMSCHQLQVSCNRAIDNGYISMEDKQEIEKLYELYNGMNWNGPGKVAYETMKKLPVGDDRI